MAHNLDQSADQTKTAFAAARVDAWHQLGKTFDREFTAEEAMTEAYLGGWDVRKSPLFTPGPDGELLEVPGWYSTIRNNPFEDGKVDVLGTVGERYHPIQNEAHAELLNTLVDESGAVFDTAGAIDGGRKVFISMKLPGHIRVGGVDPIENNLVAINSHDGSSSFNLMITPIRVVCQNTLNMAWQNNSHLVRVRHTLNSTRGIVAYAREALDMTFSYLESFQQEAKRLVETEMTHRQFDQLITAAWGVEEGDAPKGTVTRTARRLDEMSELFNADTQDPIGNTAWAGFNALTEWFDHYSDTRGEEDPAVKRAIRSVFQTNFKNEALKLMLSAVN